MTHQLPEPKAAWPLLLVAALGFIPGLGLIFGFAAVCWGLVANRRRALLAVGVGALAIVVNLAIATALVYRLDSKSGFMEAARVQGTHRDLVNLVIAIDEYRARRGHLPSSLESLRDPILGIRTVNIFDHANGMFQIPGYYEYHAAADGSSYDLFSAGLDGEPHTDDDLRPVLPDSVAARSWYRPGSI